MTTATRPAEELRRQFAEGLSGILRCPAWRAAFHAVPRETFLSDFSVRCAEGRRAYRPGDPGYLEAVYSGEPLLGQGGEPGPRPATLAAMLQALDQGEGTGEGRVLDVGTGDGYGAALLCHRFGADRVVSLDADPALVETARARLGRVGYAPALTAGDPARGCPEQGPYAALIGTCRDGRVPVAWAAQVVPGGRIVAGLGHGVAVLTVGADGGAEGSFLPYRATPPACAAAAAARSYIPALLVPLGNRLDVDLPADLSAQMPRFLGALIQPDVHDLSLIDADGRPVYGLVHPLSGSWARVAPRDDGTAQIQYDGPRHLWAERAPLLADWTEAGSPGPERYGLTIGPNGAHRLWLGSPGAPGAPDRPSRALPPPRPE